jgi:hypothetical protein
MVGKPHFDVGAIFETVGKAHGVWVETEPASILSPSPLSEKGYRPREWNAERERASGEFAVRGKT